MGGIERGELMKTMRDFLLFVLRVCKLKTLRRANLFVGNHTWRF